MASRVAVVTDSVSDGFYFPLFLSYYRRELPDADIFVVTPAGRAAIFADFGLAGIVELSIDFYDDTVRAEKISAFISELTTRYAAVIRVDCDEFAVADPRRFSSLQAYIEATPQDYVTAFGYDVVAAPSDPPLDFSQPILGTQRRYAFALNALNKTCLTRIPQKWGRGFHACQSYPKFDGLYLMHLKRADIDMQVRFGEFLAALTREDQYIRNYYLTPRDEIVSFHRNLFGREKAAGWDGFADPKFIADFFLGLKKSPDSGLWDIQYDISDHLREIPADFHGRIGPVSGSTRSDLINRHPETTGNAPTDDTQSGPNTLEMPRGRQLHDTAHAIGTKFLELYAPAGPFTVVEIGSLDVNGTLRTALPERASYIGVDAEPGRNVDIIATGHALPLPDGIADIAIASSVFEHDNMFWQTFLELCRLTKTGGYIYISAPSNGTIHRYPQDNWRFYPDAALALEDWARVSKLDVVLTESFLADRQADVWNDFVAIFRRGNSGELERTSFVYNSFSSRNVHRLGTDDIINRSERVEDQDLLAAAVETLLMIEQQVADAASELKLAPQTEDHVRRMKALTPAVPNLADGGEPPTIEPKYAIFSSSLKFIDATIAAMKNEFSKIRTEAAFRENTLRRRLKKAEDNLARARNALSFEPPADQVWFSIDRFEPTLIIGWAILITDPECRLEIRIFSGDELIASSPADTLRPHLLRWGYGDGRFGFGFDLSNRAESAGSDIRIEAKWDEGTIELGRLRQSEHSQ